MLSRVTRALYPSAAEVDKDRFYYRGIIAMTALLVPFICAADGNLPSKFSNIGSIENTRHNLTQDKIGNGALSMYAYKNNYGEVCVYCHTPHGSSRQAELRNAPLWNRTMTDPQGYQTYDKVGTSSDTAVTAPGDNSLTCLSCHDGTVAMDSVMNMPGSGRASSAQETAQNNTFLNDNWTNAIGPDASVHLGFDAVNKNMGCLVCHDSGAGFIGAGAADFLQAALGTDLANDHPVGVGLPQTGPISGDFNQPNIKVAGKIAFYDKDGDNKADSNEIRFYDTGDGFEVECASCHDPHGVIPSGGDRLTDKFNPTFLRVSNVDSDVCLTCHVK